MSEENLIDVTVTCKKCKNKFTYQRKPFTKGRRGNVKKYICKLCKKENLEEYKDLLKSGDYTNRRRKWKMEKEHEMKTGHLKGSDWCYPNEVL